MSPKEIEIKKVDVTEVPMSGKRTLYMCCFWNTNGYYQCNVPSEEKKYQENYAVSMSKHSEHTVIYEFEIDIPDFKNK